MAGKMFDQIKYDYKNNIKIKQKKRNASMPWIK